MRKKRNQVGEKGERGTREGEVRGGNEKKKKKELGKRKE
jgi:hypothetical protein